VKTLAAIAGGVGVFISVFTFFKERMEVLEPA